MPPKEGLRNLDETKMSLQRPTGRVVHICIMEGAKQGHKTKEMLDPRYSITRSSANEWEIKLQMKMEIMLRHKLLEMKVLP